MKMPTAEGKKNKSSHYIPPSTHQRSQAAGITAAAPTARQDKVQSDTLRSLFPTSDEHVHIHIYIYTHN